MNKTNAAHYLPLVQALAAGETILANRSPDDSPRWELVSSDGEVRFTCPPERYCIAPLHKCDGNHAGVVPCVDPQCWQARHSMTAKSQPADLLALEQFDQLLGRLAGQLGSSDASFAYKIVSDYYIELEAIREALAAHRGEVVAGRVNGYLPRQRAIEFITDGPIPEWLTHPNVRAYVSGVPTFEAIGRKDSGHNADWCAGWNAHLIATSHPPQAQAGAGDALVERLAIVMYAARFGFCHEVAVKRWPDVEQKSRFTGPVRAALEASHDPE